MSGPRVAPPNIDSLGRVHAQASAGSSGGGRHVRPLRLVHAGPDTGARPVRAGPATPHGLIAPRAGVLQELAKQADPNLTLDTEAQQARDHLASALRAQPA